MVALSMLDFNWQMVLAQPLRFRPTNVRGTTTTEQDAFDAVIANLTVRLEGLYLTRGATFPAGEPLIARAALNSLEIFNCTLDPGGSKKLDGTLKGTRSPIQPSMNLHNNYGFANAADETAFKQTPEIILQRTITGPLFIDTGYRLFLTESIIDAGSGVNDNLVSASYAISGTGDPSNTWGPDTQVNGITVFGRMRVESISGKGGIWVHTLEALNNQIGCIRFSYFSGNGDRLPQNHACVKWSEAKLRFVSEVLGNPAYGQLAHTTDFRIRERGPKDDAMGAFGFLLEAHKYGILIAKITLMVYCTSRAEPCSIVTGTPRRELSSTGRMRQVGMLSALGLRLFQPASLIVSRCNPLHLTITGRNSPSNQVEYGRWTSNLFAG